MSWKKELYDSFRFLTLFRAFAFKSPFKVECRLHLEQAVEPVDFST